MIERIPEFNHQPRQESFFEKQFFLNKIYFERNTGLYVDELTRMAYSSQENRFIAVPQTEQRRSLEVLFHSESSTIFVPPPTPGTITIKDLPVMAVPVVKFIDTTQPDVVVGCDRGAGVYALAVHSMWGKIQEQRLLTLDGKMHFARLSTSLGLDVTSEALFRIIKAS